MTSVFALRERRLIWCGIKGKGRGGNDDFPFRSPVSY
jgi:hypothetical protein